MINFKDAVPPAGKGMVRKINGVEQTVEYPDGWEAGTALNRANLMAMQGFGSYTVTKNADGSYTQNMADGSVVTVQKTDSGYTETLTNGTQVITMTYNKSGSTWQGVMS